MQDENGDNRADDDSGQRTTQDGEEDVIPTKRDILVDAAEIAGGIIFGGIAVALAEAGFHFWSFVVGFLAVGCGLLVLAHLFEKLGLKYVKDALVVLLFLTAALFGFLALHKSPAESKPFQHFVFSLRNTDRPSEKVELTNDFLIETNFNHVHNVFGAMIVPLNSGQSNVTLRFGIEPSFDADSVEAEISLPQSWEIVPDGAWVGVEMDFLKCITVNASGVLETNPMQSLAYKLPQNLLSGNGTVLPDIQLRHATPLGPSSSGVMGLMARAKGSPTTAISFNLFTLPNSFFGINEFVKIVGPETNLNGQRLLYISPAQFKEIKK